MSEREERDMREQLNRIEQQLARLDNFITGGDEPSNGIIVKLDRVERRQDSQVKAFWLGLGSVFVAVTTVVARMMNMGPTPK